MCAFVILRIITFSIQTSDACSERLRFRSLICSCDVIAAVCVHFVTKLAIEGGGGELDRSRFVSAATTGTNNGDPKFGPVCCAGQKDRPQRPVPPAPLLLRSVFGHHQAAWKDCLLVPLPLRKIMKLGRWTNNTFLTCIHAQIGALTVGVATAMATLLHFCNVAAPP